MGKKININPITGKFDVSEDVSKFETNAQLDARDMANRDRANHTGTQLATTISDFIAAVQTSETTTSLSLQPGNILRYTDEAGVNTDLNLTLYLDDTNLARLTSAVADSVSGVVTFTRDDASDFTVDLSFLNDVAAVNIVQTNLDQEVIDRAAADAVLQGQIDTNDAEIALNTAKVSFDEAPQDGTAYNRKDGAWEAEKEYVGGNGITISQGITPSIILATQTIFDRTSAETVGGSGFTFTSTSDGPLGTVELKMGNLLNATGNVEVQLRATDINGFPTGPVLDTSNSIDVTTLDNVAVEDVTFTFTGNVGLVNGTKYALTYNDLSTITASIYTGKESAGTYAGGDVIGFVGGVWTVAETADQYFVINSAPAPSNDCVINLDTINAADVGLGNVDNTSDANKPVSTAQQTALDLKANQADLLQEITDRAAADITLQTNIDNIPAAPVDSVNGQTGVVVVTAADVGLGNVDNTADTDKPVSMATQTILDLKANQTALAQEVVDRTNSGITLQTNIDNNTLVSQQINARSNNDRDIFLVCAGTASQLIDGQLILSDDNFVQLPGIPKESNEIEAQTITLADGEVAYININRGATAATRIVTVATPAAMVASNDTLIIARKIGDYIHIGVNRQLAIGIGDTVDMCHTQSDVSGPNSLNLVYDTVEHLTGETWIDGRPIYRRVLNFTTNVNTNTTIATWDPNLSFIDSFRRLANDEWIIDFFNASGTSNRVFILYNETTGTINTQNINGTATIEAGTNFVVKYVK